MFLANCENRDCLEVFDRFTNTVTLAQGWKIYNTTEKASLRQRDKLAIYKMKRFSSWWLFINAGSKSFKYVEVYK